MKKHFIRKRLGWNPLTNKDCYFYDFYCACGVVCTSDITCVRKKVTCKNCKRTTLYRGRKCKEV